MQDISSSAPASSLRILVVGAGIGGLGVARALAQRGIAADVVEREPAGTTPVPASTCLAMRSGTPVAGPRSAVMERADADPTPAHLRPPGPPALRHRPGAAVGRRRCLPGAASCGSARVLVSYGEPVPVRMGLPVRRLHQHGGTVTVGFGDGTTGELRPRGRRRRRPLHRPRPHAWASAVQPVRATCLALRHASARPR